MDGSSKIASWAQGAAQGKNAVGIGTCTAPFMIQDMHLGVQNVHETRYSGDIAEVLVWDRWLSDAEQKKAEEYLSEKYSIPLVKDNAAALARSAYSLKYPRIPSRQTWMHNDLPGKDSWIQGGMWDLTALPDGTFLISSVWDEMHKEIGFYKDGKPVMVPAGDDKKAFSDLYNKGIFHMGNAVHCVDSTYVYAGVSGMSKPKIGLRRFRLSDLQEAPFPGTKADTAVWTIPETPGVWKELTGMAVVGDTLFAASQGFNKLRLIDAGTGLEKSAVELPEQPGRILAMPDKKTSGLRCRRKSSKPILPERPPDGKSAGSNQVD